MDRMSNAGLEHPALTHKNGFSRLREFVRNPISLVGLVLGIVAFGNFLFLFFIDLSSEHPSPYVGILAYMVAPGFLVLGLAMVPFGVWYDRRKRRQHPAEPIRYLHVDFNDPSQRGALTFIFKEFRELDLQFKNSLVKRDREKRIEPIHAYRCAAVLPVVRRLMRNPKWSALLGKF